MACKCNSVNAHNMLNALVRDAGFSSPYVQIIFISVKGLIVTLILDKIITKNIILKYK